MVCQHLGQAEGRKLWWEGLDVLLNDLLLASFQLKVQGFIAARAKTKELQILRRQHIVECRDDVRSVPQVAEMGVGGPRFQDVVDCAPFLVLVAHLVWKLGAQGLDVIDIFLVAAVWLGYFLIPICFGSFFVLQIVRPVAGIRRIFHSMATKERSCIWQTEAGLDLEQGGGQGGALLSSTSFHAQHQMQSIFCDSFQVWQDFGRAFYRCRAIREDVLDGVPSSLRQNFSNGRPKLSRTLRALKAEARHSSATGPETCEGHGIHLVSVAVAVAQWH